jgi:hypothetical protein
MKEILNKIKPVIYIEVGEEFSAEITSILLMNDYFLYTTYGKRIEKCIFNTLALPNN